MIKRIKPISVHKENQSSAFLKSLQRGNNFLCSFVLEWRHRLPTIREKDQLFLLLW